MTKNELGKKIYDVSHLTGEFLLRSGTISNEYFDKYRFESYPELLSSIAGFMKDLVPSHSEILAGLETGGIPLSTAISLQNGMPSIFVRKEAKTYGTCKLAEGIEFDGKSVCVIEDVVTTGGQIIKSVKELRERGAIIDTVLCVILRDEAAYKKLGEAGLTLIPLFTMEELKKLVE
ncbi:MAG: orotate phosphoribosyltransferase [Melioribacteraceae bacterium]|nr:orotate phosphoribosyltransferase [Melioribacteraceae bacterium]MCF8264074.1 orotate phosphoribosyltransferase [Melioribacteraceae bacterium]MCF8413304.1 orotate phosphoribosyltransferase [Melioribacteraceae bacterium]MCF8430843.1 orotate phosphoribosyltransferase [Melioribacteraceae bacterium]